MSSKLTLIHVPKVERSPNSVPWKDIAENYDSTTRTHSTSIRSILTHLHIRIRCGLYSVQERWQKLGVGDLLHFQFSINCKYFIWNVSIEFHSCWVFYTHFGGNYYNLKRIIRIFDRETKVTARIPLYRYPDGLTHSCTTLECVLCLLFHGRAIIVLYY